MPKAPPRKPSGAAGSFGLSKGQTQCVIAAVVIAVIIGLSHVFSPTEEDAATPAAAGKAATAVTALDDASFDKFVASHPDGVLVDFYSQSCKFCVKLAPEFEKAAKELKKGGPPLVSVESESGAAIVQKYGISRYPTVLWFWKGQNVLELPRASEKVAAKIVDWAKWAVTPAVQELETRAEFDEALSTLRSSLHATGRLMVAFHRDGSEGLLPAFEAAAQRGRTSTVFLYIKTGNAAGEPMLKSFGQKEADDEEHKGAATEEEVVKWVKETLDKAKPPAAAETAEEPAKVEEAKPAATMAMEQVQKALLNAEAAKESADGDAKE